MSVARERRTKGNEREHEAPKMLLATFRDVVFGKVRNTWMSVQGRRLREEGEGKREKNWCT